MFGTYRRIIIISTVSSQILSIGGNDVRQYLGTGDADTIWRNLEAANFTGQFDDLVGETVAIQPRTIMVLVYHPLAYEKTYPSYKKWIFKYGARLPTEDVFTKLLKKASVLLEIGKKYKLPVIDLSRTFDPYQVHSFDFRQSMGEQS